MTRFKASIYLFSSQNKHKCIKDKTVHWTKKKKQVLLRTVHFKIKRLTISEILWTNEAERQGSARDVDNHCLQDETHSMKMLEGVMKYVDNKFKDITGV